MAATSDRIDEIFWNALQLPAGDERHQYLAQACGVDTDSRGLVERLLKAQPQVNEFL